MVCHDDFVCGIRKLIFQFNLLCLEQLLVQSNQSPTRADLRRYKFLRDIPSESFKTICLENELDVRFLNKKMKKISGSSAQEKQCDAEQAVYQI